MTVYFKIRINTEFLAVQHLWRENHRIQTTISMVISQCISSITHTTVINAAKSDDGIILMGGADRVIRRA